MSWVLPALFLLVITVMIAGYMHDKALEVKQAVEDLIAPEPRPSELDRIAEVAEELSLSLNQFKGV